MGSGSATTGTQMRCVAVVVATVIESYIHYRATKKVRYTAYMADPIAYLK